MRIGVLTGGGDCPGLNAVIRAAVVRTLRTHHGRMLGFENGWLGLQRDLVRELDRNAITGTLKIEFGMPVDLMRPFAKELVLSVLDEFGLDLPDFASWSADEAPTGPSQRVILPTGAPKNS